MENSRCKAFIECVNCGSIKAAADLMGYTPSAVSQLITAFEKELGLRLFVRTQKGVGNRIKRAACPQAYFRDPMYRGRNTSCRAKDLART